MTTRISNFFIDNFFKSANPSYIVVYILLLRLCENGECQISGAADFLQVMESDIRRALAYWAENGALSYTEENGALKIDFLCEQDGEAAEPRAYELPAIAVTRPVYTPKEIFYCMDKSPLLQKLFKSCERHMGKPLSHNDMCVIFSFHDWLRFSPELIELLVEYCCSNEHRSIRYIEKVAVTWADAGISTPEKARERIKLYNKDYRRIMSALGKAHREPVKAEEEFMLKWLKVYKLPVEVVEAACERTVLQASRPTFKYADGIIGKWFQQGVSTLDGVERAEEEHRSAAAAKAEAGAEAKGGVKKPKKTRFSNFKEREATDFSEIQRLEMERIDREMRNMGN